MTTVLWRVSAPELIAGRYASLIEDTGALRAAVAASDGTYRFSETGAGVKPLAFIGTLLQISRALAAHPQRRIVSDIDALPYIHAGLDRFTPKARFREAFSIGTVGIQVTRSLLDFFPTGSSLGGTIAELLLGGQTMTTLLNEIFADKTLSDAVDAQDRKHSQPYILRVSYLPEDGLHQVGAHEVTFGQLLEAFGRTGKAG
jgi:hypothetical protein